MSMVGLRVFWMVFSVLMSALILSRFKVERSHGIRIWLVVIRVFTVSVLRLGG